MSAESSPKLSSDQAMELKGRMLSVTRLRLLTSDTQTLQQQIDAFAKTMPRAIKGMPVVIDSDLDADLAALLECLRVIGMQPLGVSEGPLAAPARARGLAVLSRDSGKQTERPAEKTRPAAKSKPRAAEPTRAAPRSARIVEEPVRSGQQIYAEGGDLVVLNSVSVGAEVIADGCVHVYGRLSGRAIAGASGDETARVFCRRMDAQLIAIAGVYAVSEQIEDAPRDVAAQAFLDQGRLVIEAHSV